LPGVTVAKMLEQMMIGYENAFDPGLDPDDVSAEKPETVKVVIKRALRRSWRHLAEERIEDTEPNIPLGKRFWPLSREEKAALRELSLQDDLRKLATVLKSRDDDSSVEMVDAAYWMKGCSSLGRLRFAALLRVSQGAKASEYCLMDIKEAILAAAPRSSHAKMPRDNAGRVVEGARHLSPHLGNRMVAARLLDKGVFIRELLPQDLKIEIDQLTRSEAITVASYLAGVVGKAHARQMNASTRKEWKEELGRNRLKTVDTPSWLWSSIVSLIINHEGGYLEHCRRYAMNKAAA
jgi:uncharacterized protein (DUF2252 family)